MLRVIITYAVIFLLSNTSYVDVIDEDETIYIDGDDDLNKEFTKVEIIEHGRYSEVFSDDIVAHTRKQVEAHVSSSTEDLFDIFIKEQTLIQRLIGFLEEIEESNIKPSNLKKIRKSINGLLEYFVIIPETSMKARIKYLERIMENPIAAFNLLWRTGKIWPQKIKILTAHYKSINSGLKKQKQILKSFPDQLLSSFPTFAVTDVTAAARGILAIQHYSNITCEEMRTGLGDLSQSLQGEQMLEIGKTALATGSYHLAVQWFLTAELSLHGSEDTKLRQRLRQMAAEAKETHDGHLIANGYIQYNAENKNTYNCRDKPYDEDLHGSEIFKIHKNNYDELVKFSSRDVDLSKENISKNTFWNCIYIGEDPRRQRLCQGIHPSSPPLHCQYLHHQDHFLLLAPFKYEELKKVPAAGVILDVASPGEMEKVRQEARGKMITTTLVDYNTPDDVKDDYTSRRTSKVTYRSEKSLADPLRSWTRRIEQATRLDLTSTRLSSENYQIMNYGLGGAILTHRDSDDKGLDDPIYSESWHNGGPRLATVMVWLSGVRRGGRTVFAGAGLSVAPRPGSALIWWNLRSDGSLDSRNHHTGCPVAWGNKWIANKWVKWPSQMWTYPCSTTRGQHYAGINMNRVYV